MRRHGVPRLEQSRGRAPITTSAWKKVHLCRRRRPSRRLPATRPKARERNCRWNNCLPQRRICRCGNCRARRLRCRSHPWTSRASIWTRLRSTAQQAQQPRLSTSWDAPFQPGKNSHTPDCAPGKLRNGPKGMCRVYSCIVTSRPAWNPRPWCCRPCDPPRPAEHSLISGTGRHRCACRH